MDLQPTLQPMGLGLFNLFLFFPGVEMGGLKKTLAESVVVIFVRSFFSGVVSIRGSRARAWIACLS